MQVREKHYLKTHASRESEICSSMRLLKISYFLKKLMSADFYEKKEEIPLQGKIK